MKKILLLALVFVAGASVSTAWAGKKKEKKDQQAQTEQTVVTLSSSIDSLSYAAGKAATRGLIPYVQQQYQVDTAYMTDFVRGFKDALGKANDLNYAAYLAGAQIARMVQQRILPGTQKDFEGTRDSIDSKLFIAGFVSALSNDTAHFTEDAAQQFFEQRRKADKEAVRELYKAENEKWLAENAKKEGVKVTANGLQYKVLTAGTGAVPKPTDEVVVKYEGKLIDGTIFDSSYKRDPQIAVFRCDGLIKGWTEALTMMPAGSKWELYVPQSLAYGASQVDKIKPYSTLIFTVELVEIKQPKPEVKPAAELTPAKKAPAKKAPRKRK